jgi:hypothetical protein
MNIRVLNKLAVYISSCTLSKLYISISFWNFATFMYLYSYPKKGIVLALLLCNHETWCETKRIMIASSSLSLAKVIKDDPISLLHTLIQPPSLFSQLFISFSINTPKSSNANNDKNNNNKTNVNCVYVER